MRRHVVASLLCFAAVPAAYAAPDCAGGLVPAPLKTPATVIAPVAPEFTATATQLGAPSGVLASHAFDEAQSVDRVLLRLRIEGCRNVAKALPAPTGAPAAIAVGETGLAWRTAARPTRPNATPATPMSAASSESGASTSCRSSGTSCAAT